MKFIPAEDGQVLHRLELTRRNLETLLAKLDDPLSNRKLIDPDWHIIVGAEEEYHPDGSCTIPIETEEGVIVPGAGECVFVVPVENEVHYADREPGAVYMPSTGETL